MNLKLKMAIMSAAVVLMLAAAAVIIFGGQNDTDLDKQLERAGTYLVNSDYDNAIAIYNRIISADSSCAEAYAGLSEAYFAKNKANKAFDVLKKGAQNTGNDKIVTDKLNELFPDMEYAEALYGLEDGFEYNFDDGQEDVPEDNAAVTDVTQTETSVTETTAAEVSDKSETEATSETVSETETTTSASTTAAPVVTTAPPVTTTPPPVVTTAPPVTTTAPPAATTTVPTTRATTVTTTVTTTEALKDVSVTDLTLMSLDEAYAWCSKNNLILNVVGTEDGSSKILSQSPAPSAVVKENSTVIVILAE